MVRVCVVGGGTAGSEAAAEAIERGADVTVIEQAGAPDPPWRSWPDLVSPRQPTPSPPTASRPLQDSCRVLSAPALSTRSGAVTTAQGVELRFESVILCTGSAFAPPAFQGFRKRAVHILDSPGSYAALGRECSGSESVVIAGEGFRGLLVADRVAGGNRRVSLLASHWKGGTPSLPILEVIAHAARDRGVRLAEGSLTRAIGTGRLEAVVCNSEVMACDTLGFVPPRVPRVIPTDARLGVTGGLAVDCHLRTTARSTYAAGGCAELNSFAGTPETLDAAGALSGRVAGANSTGGKASMRRVPFGQTTAFGLRLTRMGLGLRGARALGPAFDSVSHQWEGSSACTVLFERTTAKVLGIELVEPEGASPPGPIPISTGTTLEALAYGLGSSDISLLSDSARLGIRVCQRS